MKSKYLYSRFDENDWINSGLGESKYVNPRTLSKEYRFLFYHFITL